MDRRYFGTNKLYRSASNTSWTAVSGDLTGGPHSGNAGQVRGTLTALAVSPLDGQVLWAGSDDGYVNVSANGGTNWTNVAAALPDRWVTSIHGDPFDRETAYVTISGFRWTEALPHVFRTTDLGATWEPIAAGLPEAPVNDLIPDPATPGRLWAATDVGVYVTQNGGASWSMLGFDLPNVVVNHLAFDPVNRLLYAGTYGRSVFTCAVDELTAAPPAELAAAGRLLAPYPNPSAEGSLDRLEPGAARRCGDRRVQRGGAARLVRTRGGGGRRGAALLGRRRCSRRAPAQRRLPGAGERGGARTRGGDGHDPALAFQRRREGGMKRLAGLLAVLIPLSASAQGEPILWLTADPYPGEISGCSLDVSSHFLTIPVYLFVETWPGQVESVAAVEFRIDHLPGLAQGMLVTHTWHTLLVDGDPAVGIALAFDPPQVGQRVALGRVDLFVVSTWQIGNDWCFGVAPSLISGQLRLLDGDGGEHACEGYAFVLNCTEFCAAAPTPASTAVERSSWGQVKQLY